MQNRHKISPTLFGGPVSQSQKDCAGVGTCLKRCGVIADMLFEEHDDQPRKSLDNEIGWFLWLVVHGAPMPVTITHSSSP